MTDTTGSMIKVETAGGATYAPSFEAIAGLSTKLAALASEIGPVTKDGTNKHFHYAFVSYEQVAASIRAHMADAGLSFSVGVSERWQDSKGVTLATEAIFTDNETGAMRLVRWYGEGNDTQDKGTAKALTSAIKYGLMRMFLLSTQEDMDSDKDAPSTRQQEPPPANRPYAPETLRNGFDWRLKDKPDTPPSSGNRGRTVGALNDLFTFGGTSKEAANDMRHKLTMYLVGEAHSAMFTDAQCNVFLSWAQETSEAGENVPHPMAVQEAALIVKAVEAAQGQQPLMGGE